MTDTNKKDVSLARAASRKLPPNLHPFETDHPASCAYRMHLSPHEWKWTQDEQEAMAKAVVARDYELNDLKHRLELTEKAAGDCEGAMLGKVNPKSPAWASLKEWRANRSTPHP